MLQVGICGENCVTNLLIFQTLQEGHSVLEVRRRVHSHLEEFRLFLQAVVHVIVGRRIVIIVVRLEFAAGDILYEHRSIINLTGTEEGVGEIKARSFHEDHLQGID